MEKKNFWDIIEADLHPIEIPKVIKNSFDICGFDNPLSFKNVNDEEIDKVEIFVRENSINNIAAKSSQIDVKLHQFRFLPGERIFIKELVRHVRQIINAGGAEGLQHFIKPGRSASDDSSRKPQENSTNDTRTHYLLNKLIEAADRNSTRKKGGFRYNSEIKKYASHLRLICGPLAYQTIQRNLQYSLPSLPSTNRYINAANSRVYECVLRSEELLIYLNQRNLDLVVSLSVDATRIEGKPQYDSKTNQIIGFVPPLNRNGLPIPYSFPARNETEICSHFSGENIESSFLNVVMAQPISLNAKAFCLLAFGSDNRYTSKDISNSWKYLIQELAKIGIKALTIASDCDPKYSASMREQSKLGGIQSELGDWFSCDESATTFYVQDFVHIGTKLRNFFLRTTRNEQRLPFGKYFIKWSHLYTLLTNVTKDQHQLTATILNPKDRQNFSSVLKMCHSRVINLLKIHVKDSDGTIFYLQMMNDVLEAYMNVDLTPLQRIRKIWFPLFVIRIWRNQIEKYYSLKENFLTSYSYFCIEQNAHSLILIMLHLKKINRSDLFLPHLYSSQPCESLFRAIRSFTPTYSTVTNCTMKAATATISKIQYQYDVVNETAEYFFYPRPGKHDIANEIPSKVHTLLPTKDEIVNEISKCKHDAIAAAKKFGLPIDRKKNSYVCKVPPYKPNTHTKKRKRLYRNIIFPNVRNVQLINYADKVKSEDITEKSPYVEITSKKRLVVKKTSLVWYLRKDCQKLSSDRLLRVQNTYTHIKRKKKKLNRRVIRRYIRRINTTKPTNNE